MTAELPRYVQIFNTLSRRVETGKYPVDMSLPTESELCDEFNASRFTVREALRRLVERGMVQRRQGAGSIVISTTPQARYAYSLSSLSDLFQFALDTHYQLLSTSHVKPDAEIAADIGGSAGRTLVAVEGPASQQEGWQNRLLRALVYRPTRRRPCERPEELCRTFLRAPRRAHPRRHTRGGAGYFWRQHER